MRKTAPIRQDLVERDQRIWMQRVRGASLAEIAAEHKITKARVSQVLAQVAATLPPDTVSHLKTVALEVHDKIRQDLFELAEKPPAPSFAPNGKPLLDPETEKPIYDYKLRLEAYNTLIKELQLWQRLTGVDAPTQHAVVETSEAVQQATQKRADEIEAKLSSLFAAA
jgi:predicted DNA-binding protein YlxM (UPF0122 family)